MNKYYGSLEWDLNPQYTPVFWRNIEQQTLKVEVTTGKGSMSFDIIMLDQGLEETFIFVPSVLDISEIDYPEKDTVTFIVNCEELKYDFDYVDDRFKYLSTKLYISRLKEFKIIRKYKPKN